MIAYLVMFGIFMLIVVVIGAIALVQQYRMSMEERAEEVRESLLKRETSAGSTFYTVGSMSKISKDMAIEIAEVEGFVVVDNGHSRVMFQREVPAD